MKRDKQKLISVYVLAKSFLINQLHNETDNENISDILAYYLKPHKSNEAKKLSEIYYQILEHAQNANMKPKVIGGSIGGIKNLKTVLFNFNPEKVVNHYDNDHEKLLDDIIKTLQPVGKLNREPNGLWVQYCKSILSSAYFLKQFKNGAEFHQWTNALYQNEETIDELPQQLEREIHGLGYALAVDFLKEIGYCNYGKPDVHIKDILKGVGLCTDKPKDIEVQKILRKIAKANEVSAYNVDKILWLVGSGSFYAHDITIGKNKQEFIEWFMMLDELGR